MAVGFLADYLGVGGAPGMGPRQNLMAVTGVVLLLIGLILKNPDWRQDIFSSGTVTPKQYLLMVIWFGLLIGFGDVITLVIQISRIGIPRVNPHFFWLKPVANLALFGVIGLLLYIFLLRWLRAIPVRLFIPVFVFLGFGSWLLPVAGLHLIAVILLSLGVSVHVSKFIANHTTRFYGVVRRTLPWFAGLAVALCLGVNAWKLLPEYRITANLPPAKPGAPNVLLIVLDTVRAQSLSVYDYERPTTPILERFSRTGVCFDNAYATSPWTLPSHATMFTGRFTHELFDSNSLPLDARTPLPETYPTLSEVLNGQGYYTGGFVANFSYCSYAHALDRGFARYEDYTASLEWFLSCSSLGGGFYNMYLKAIDDWQMTGRKFASDINNSFLEWIDGKDDRPFFAFLNYFDAHTPYLPPPPFDQKFGYKKPNKPLGDMRHQNRKYTPEEIETYRTAYDACIAYMDHQIGVLLDTLQDKGILENTIVIITSDHGEEFGEHELFGHAKSLYRQVLHVPLLISFPETVPVDKRVKEFVSLRDLPATIADLIGSEGEVRFPGRSLARYWENSLATDSDSHGSDMPFAEVLIGRTPPDWWSESWPITKGSMKSLIIDPYHFIRNGDHVEELYDLQNDPQERHELSQTAEGGVVLKDFRRALESFRAKKEVASN